MLNRKKTSKKNERKRPAGFSLDPALVSELRALAKEDDRSLSYLVGCAIREFLNRRSGKAA